MSAPNEALVNALAMMSPYGLAEKQAMLEAPDLKTWRRDPDRGHRDGPRQETHQAAIHRCSRRQAAHTAASAFSCAGCAMLEACTGRLK